MPIEPSEQSAAPPTGTTLDRTSFDENAPQQQQQSQEQSQQQEQPHHHVDIEQNKSRAEIRMDPLQRSEEMSTSQRISKQSSNGQNGSCSGSGGGSGKKTTTLMSPDPTAYVAKARVTRPTPPPPPYNPMQFVQIKPCSLYQTAQEQLKKAEEVKKITEIKKEEPEDWQNNLDNWKSSRRKRVEHIIDRVVEVKKLELEEHDRTRRKSKTLSEMMEERGERGGGVRNGRGKLAPLAVYNEDETNDLSDLGIGTSSASGKSSLSEDYDNHSVLSDNAELEKATVENNHKASGDTTREYVSSPGYDTSSSTAPASSPDPGEYTYEGAIQDYKQRVSRAAASGRSVAALARNPNHNGHHSKESTPERNNNNGNNNGNSNGGLQETYAPRRGSKIEDRLMGFEVTSPSEECAEKSKVDLPKIDISKRKEIFENPSVNSEPKPSAAASSSGGNVVPRVTLRDRFRGQESSASPSEGRDSVRKEVKRLSGGDITSIRERLQSLEQQQQQQQQQQNAANGANGAASKAVDIPVPPLKDRLSSLQSAASREEVRKPPVALVDARQLEIMKHEEQEQTAQRRLREAEAPQQTPSTTTTTMMRNDEATARAGAGAEAEAEAEDGDGDRDDSGIHTSDDVEAEGEAGEGGDGDGDEAAEERQEQQVNAAFAALALEEQQLERAADAVNQIEAQFEELTRAPPAPSAAPGAAPTNDQMEFSVSSTNSLPYPSRSLRTSDSNGNGSCSASAASSSRFGVNEKDENVKDEQDEKDKKNETDEGRRKDEMDKKDQKYEKDEMDKKDKKDEKNEMDKTDKKDEKDEMDKKDEKVEKDKKDEASSAKAAPPLRRKPSNEMVHARNLLKMFKETFQDDIELDVESEPPTTRSKPPEARFVPASSPFVETRIFQSSPPPAAGSFNAPPMLPRPINPAGKPPMSPKALRSPKKFLPPSPLNSPTAARRPDNPFSINGRVEIFNSKYMSEAAAGSAGSAGRPPTPTTVASKRAQSPRAASPVLPKTSPPPSPRSPIGFPQRPDVTATVPTKPTALPPTGEPSAASSRSCEPRSVPGQRVSEPGRETRSPRDVARAADPLQSKQQQQQQQQQPEVVACAPPITVLNPDELPKPNTVKALSSCFAREGGGKPLPPALPPKPMPRSRLPPHATPPQSPTAAKRNLQPDSVPHVAAMADDAKKLSLVPSDRSSNSSDSTVVEATLVQTTASVYDEPEIVAALEALKDTPTQTVKTESREGPEGPGAAAGSDLDATKAEPTGTESPTAVAASPLGPTADRPLEDDAALCSSLLSSLATATRPQRQLTVEERSCEKVDVDSLPPNKQPPSTAFADVNVDNGTEGRGAQLGPRIPLTLQTPVQRQLTVEEVKCSKLDVNTLPDDKRPPNTTFHDVSPTEIKLCESAYIVRSGPTEPTAAATPAAAPRPSSKPNSPIMAARAAHSRALIETCERIIAEERQASSQLKSSLPATPKSGTPVGQRKCRIPKPIPCCKAAESLTEADLQQPDGESPSPPPPEAPLAPPASTPTKDEENLVIARMHVVETQIKVTTTTPPATPKVNLKTHPHNAKKTKNIFDFLKKNFGVHRDEEASAASEAAADGAEAPDTIVYDEILTVDNSKFYLPSEEIAASQPAAPAPVNIEITRKITTDEILEDAQEINEMLDVELNKLNQEMDEIKRMEEEGVEQSN